MRVLSVVLVCVCGGVLALPGCRAPGAATVSVSDPVNGAPNHPSETVRVALMPSTTFPQGGSGGSLQVPADVDSDSSPIRVQRQSVRSFRERESLDAIGGARGIADQTHPVRSSPFAAAVAAVANGGARTNAPARPSNIARTGFEGLESATDENGSLAVPDEPESASRFEIPAVIPGAESPRLTLPGYDPALPAAERRSRIEALYGDLLPLPPEPEPEGPALTLGDFEQLAFQYSPKIREQWAAVQSARGEAVQAGLYPNPEVGYQSDTVNTGATAGYHGGFLSQTFVTAGKLDLATQTAQMKVRAVEYEYLRSRYQVAGDVRRAFFGVLIGRERLRLARALSTMSEETYQAQIELVIGGQSAAYEPMQLRVLALTARNELVRAENSYQAAWRQLAAAIGQPDYVSRGIAGSVDVPAAAVSYDAARSSMLSRHTALSTSQARIAGANWNLELQRNTPIPNVNVYGAVQYDDTSPLDDVTYNLQIGIPLPLFNRNQGNISSAQADLTAAQNNLNTTRNDLVADLAENYGRYSSGRQLAQVYRGDILPSQVQAYRGIYERFRAAGGDVDFAQVVLAQQTLGQAVSDYLEVLGEAWQATADLSELLQVDDLYSMDGLARVGADLTPPQAPPAALQ